MAEQVCLAGASANFSQDGFCSEMGFRIHRSFDLNSTLYKTNQRILKFMISSETNSVGYKNCKSRLVPEEFDC